MQFIPSEIEKKWKEKWAEWKLYKISNDSDKEKFYILDMFPYPSGSGLHVGHPLGYVASDIFSRYKTMKGFNVLHPMGFDAFGLPAEQYAIQTGIHPAESTATNIQKYLSLAHSLGFNYDWDRSVNTSKPEFYRWTQSIFLKLYNAYYNIEENKAKPIDELINAFATSGSKNINAHTEFEGDFTAVEWKSMTELEQQDILMHFRLAYRKKSYVNWCEALGTVLANDEIKDGLSERGGHPVEKKAMLQWSLRITAYAERLLNGLESLDWSESLKAMQRNWIGKSTGAQVFFNVENSDLELEIFTTRPDTIFGATFMVIAPEHPQIKALTSDEQKEEVEEYIKYVSTRSDVERQSEVKKITGTFTGSYAIHPFSGDRIPIWTSEYVLIDYGSGAIMAVPSDDDRDKKFAEQFDLKIIEVVDKSAFPDATSADKIGVMINSDFLNGMHVNEAIDLAIEKIEEKKLGSRKINYKLRDANFSRQRYWGEPFPIMYNEKGVIHSANSEELPVELPDLKNFEPTSDGKSPLARVDEWVNVKDYTRETDTMPGYAGSSWYFLRYMDPSNEQAFASKAALDYWKEVDLYIGGTEHAVGHLMYSRFWHKFLYDLKLVPTQEPFKKLVNQGMIQGVIEYVYLLKEKQNGQTHFISYDLVDQYGENMVTKIPVHVSFVEDYGTEFSNLSIDSIKKFIEWRPENKGARFISSKGYWENDAYYGDNEEDFKLITESEVGKMSKRYYNVINPDDVVAQYGADCFRMYEMFLGPLEQSKPWDTKGIDGVSKFLRKLWSLFYAENGELLVTDHEPSKAALKTIHKTIDKVSNDIEHFRFNTCISAFMVAVNELKKQQVTAREVLEHLVRLLAPFAPFITEELWKALGHDTSVHKASYPIFDASKTVEDEKTYPVCFNGKKRLEATFSNALSKDEIAELVLSIDGIDKYLGDKQPKKIIVVPGRMINIVI